jgi:hypothetical protein
MSQQQQPYVSDRQRVKELLSKCGLNQYYERFAEEGFDQLKSVRIHDSLVQSSDNTQCLISHF